MEKHISENKAAGEDTAVVSDKTKMSAEQLRALKERVLAKGAVSREEASMLGTYPDLDALCDAANEIREAFCGDEVDSCSIVNARSGRCSEDCKWCAQSAHHHTHCDIYEMLPIEDMLEAAGRNDREGIHRFSLVTSGRGMTRRDLEKFCEAIRVLKEKTGLYLCASMGLLGEEEMRMLKEAGVERYHCNMETDSVNFARLCTTHSHADKKRTIAAARAVGLDVCSGGIIGMGESMEDRINFAFELAELDVDSVPVNILNPIPGTPLADTPLISEEEVIRTIAVFRFILPGKAIRFAGGRMRLSHESMLRIMRGGMSGVLMGDMLTTVSNTIADDRKLFAEAGMKFSKTPTLSEDYNK